jgi:hypothetical protein
MGLNCATAATTATYARHPFHNNHSIMFHRVSICLTTSATRLQAIAPPHSVASTLNFAWTDFDRFLELWKTAVYQPLRGTLDCSYWSKSIPIGIINALYAWFDSHWTSARLSDHTRVNGLNGRGETNEMQKKYPDSALIQTWAFSVSYRYCR